jgi:hypothetical protein
VSKLIGAKITWVGEMGSTFKITLVGDLWSSTVGLFKMGSKRVFLDFLIEARRLAGSTLSYS